MKEMMRMTAMTALKSCGRFPVLLGGAVGMLAGQPYMAHAMVCPGVEARVIAYNEAAGANSIAHIGAGFASLDAMITAEMQMLISAQKIATAQESASADQENTMQLKAAEAAASVYVAGQNARQVRETTDQFESTGYNACTMEQAMGQFYTGYQTAFSGDPTSGISSYVENRPGRLSSPAEWISKVKDGTNTSAAPLYSGDLDAASRYINVVMGPPDNWKKSGQKQTDAAARMAQVRKLTSDARKNSSMRVLSAITRENATNGPQKAIDNVVSQYVGDGGERWAASMAGSDTRGILLDAVRIEAANVAAEAYEVRKSMQTEFALATYALAHEDSILHGHNQAANGVVIGSGGF